MGFGGKKKELKNTETVYDIVSAQGWGEVVIGSTSLKARFDAKVRANNRDHEVQKKEIQATADQVKCVKEVVISKRPVRGYWKVTINFTASQYVKSEDLARHFHRLFG